MSFIDDLSARTKRNITIAMIGAMGATGLFGCSKKESAEDQFSNRDKDAITAVEPAAAPLGSPENPIMPSAPTPPEAPPSEQKRVLELSDHDVYLAVTRMTITEARKIKTMAQLALDGEITYPENSPLGLLNDEATAKPVIELVDDITRYAKAEVTFDTEIRGYKKARDLSAHFSDQMGRHAESTYVNSQGELRAREKGFTSGFPSSPAQWNLLTKMAEMAINVRNAATQQPDQQISPLQTPTTQQQQTAQAR